MRINHGLRGACVSLASVLVTPAALAGPNGQACCVGCSGHESSAIEATPALQAAIEASLFRMLPEDQKSLLAASELARLDAIGAEIASAQDAQAQLEGPFDYEKVASVISRESWDALRPFHQKLLVTLADAPALPEGEVRPALCFTPDTNPELVFAVSSLLGYTDTTRFQQTNRWSSTASGGTGTQGTPITLTYSFVPDGTFVPNITGFTGNSQLFAWLNGIYGSPANWQPLFAQVFNRWSEVMNVTYIYEPNDDGSNLNTGSGVLGVRGDLRIAAIPLDGNSGVLAYNNFPNDGDMVFDAFDSFYNSTASNSLRFRNVAAHEHGHGAGMLHVCPAIGVKLMEPFISLAYDGPQPDDILNGQRHYGDINEPNDNSGSATNLGSLSTGQNAFVNDVSIDDDADTDYYRFTVSGSQGVTITATPAAPAPYQQGTQTQACNSGTVTDYNVIHNLALQLIGTDGSTILASSNISGLGQPEVLSASVPAGGTYYIRVLGGSANSIQLYDLGLDVTAPPFEGVLITLPGGAPDQVDPGVTTNFTVDIDPRNESIVGTPQLSVAADGVNYSNIPLTFVSGTTWTATLPAFLCADTPRFFVQATGTVTGPHFVPSSAPIDAFSAIVGDFQTVISDDFETDMGWTVSNIGLTDGPWGRGTPIGGGDRGDPPSDYDGSGQCYLTDNVDGNSDVDGGQTILISPIFDGSGQNAQLAYARWFDNTGSGTGSNPGSKTFLVQISNNGGSSWQALETVGPNTSESSGGWFYVSFDIASVITPSASMRVRFIAQDPDPGAVVEAGVDAFSVTSASCTDPEPSCVADWDNSGGQPNSSDFLAYLNDYSAMDPAADLAPPGGNGVFDSSDFLAYLNAYSQGC
ncbi:MAG: GC-type dockerin domain-anchored protein [Phycisphaerales bacterium]|jgi:hypothetical protein|nr:GC-type dockerin domain-anchored protein [Phycisphaerales bacterium]